MPVDLLLLWTICLSCCSIFLRAIRSPHYRGWSVVSGCILAVTATLAFLLPQFAVAVGGSLWGSLILLPLWGFARVNQLMNRQRYRAARRLAMQLRWLHPADGWLEHPQLLLALEMGQRGETEDAIAILNRYRSEQTPFGRQAMTLLLAMEASWDQLLAWLERYAPQPRLGQEINLVPYYLRALGETGNLNALVREVRHFLPLLEQNRNANAANWARMLVFAFCGYPQQVERLLQNSLGSSSPALRQFWLLSARIAAAPHENAYREQLAALEHSRDPLLRKAIAWRLSPEREQGAPRLDDVSREILARLSRETPHPISYALALTFIPKAALTTYSLIALNLFFFGLEIKLGGSENLDVLYQLGAVVPLEVGRGEWWRLVNANFLHFGSFHLAANMLGLFFLGPFVELRLNSIRYLLIYLASGIGSMYFFTVISLASPDRQQLLVGASASIMGLIGATTAVLLKGYWVEKDSVAGQRLRFIILISIIQVIFDFSIPQISFLAHALGYSIGFVLGLLLILK